MIHIGNLFWIIPVVLLLTMGRRRAWRRWDRVRPLDPGHTGIAEVAELHRELEEQRAHNDQLEERVLRLEEGLDFAERVLSQRRDQALPQGNG